MKNQEKISNTDRIIAAAEACILERHLPKATMEIIAKRAGLSRKTVYRTFKNRDELLGTLFEKHMLQSISRRVKNKIKKLDLEESVIQGNLITIRQVQSDPFFIETVEQGGASWFQQQLKNYDSEVNSRIRREAINMWKEKLDDSRELGELNPELSNEEIIEWFSIVNYSLIMWQGKRRAHQAEIIRKLVLPALRNPAVKQSN